ncbi:MAG: ZIP family metal transporter [Gemmatimonadaceae bacterium]
MLLWWILGFSVLGSIGAIGGAAVVLVAPDTMRKRLLPCLLSYATGTLLGAAFLGMIPTALRQAAPTTVSASVLAGLVLFFVLEKLVIWRHCHDDECEEHRGAASVILLGDAFHNFLDGVAIAAAFLTSVPLGVATSLAVIAHEVPQEVGDFAILLHGGYSKRRAFAYNLLSSTATVPGALLGYLFLDEARLLTPFFLAVSAASFIYVAMADLVPHLHRQLGLRSLAAQSALLLAGIATIAAFRILL